MFFFQFVSFVLRRWYLCLFSFDADRRGFIFVLAEIVQALKLVVLLPFHPSTRRKTFSSFVRCFSFRLHTDSETRSTHENERNRVDQHGKAYVSYFYLPFTQR